MAVLEFACPYCNGQFEIADPPAGMAVTCPHCGAAVALPVDLPPASQAIQPSPPIEFVAPHAAPFIPLDIVTAPTTPVGPGRGCRARRGPAPEVSRLSREKQAQRRLQRNLVLMATGLLLLTIAVAVLSRF